MKEYVKHSSLKKCLPHPYNDNIPQHEFNSNEIDQRNIRRHRDKRQQRLHRRDEGSSHAAAIQPRLPGGAPVPQEDRLGRHPRRKSLGAPLRRQQARL